MSAMVRLWEKLTGQPHRLDHAAMVSDATSRLRDRVSQFEKSIKPYEESDDALGMFLTDAFNQRVRIRGYDEPKHHP